MITFFKKLPFLLGKYEAVAFISGFALMAYEMVASRVLAPSIGSSIYVWTSVIGVMIAALAIGYAFGGWLADKRVAERDIAWLLMASAVAMAGTLFFYEHTLYTISNTITDQRMQGVVAAITLFMPASFLLGTVSPYLARLRVKSVATTGRSVAGLSALNSVGGISGTFCAGFVFFSLFGSRETLALLVGILLLASWLILPRYRPVGRAVVTASLVVMMTLQFSATASATDHIASIDTPTTHYDVQLRNYEGRQVRVLTTDPFSYQSGVYTDGSKETVFNYARRIVQVVDAAPHKDKIAILGGGAFTLPETLGKKYPNAQVDVVEIDPELREISKKYFNYDEPANVRTIHKDARAFLHEAKGAQYDLIIVDAYGNDTSIPFALTTKEYAAELKEAAKDTGAVISNIVAGVSPACRPLLDSFTASYSLAFANDATLHTSNKIATGRQNMILVASNAPLDWVQPFEPIEKSAPNDARVLSDNFAPVEPLVQQCRSASYL